MKRALVLAAAASLLASTAAYAHVTVMPREAAKASETTYTFNVPTEGASPTTSVEVEAPEGVQIVSIDGPSADYAAERANGRIVSVKWTVNIPSTQSKQLKLIARNPASGERVLWKVHQRFADGSHVEWAGEPGTRLPAPATKLID